MKILLLTNYTFLTLVLELAVIQLGVEAVFSEELAGFDVSKGTIRLPYDRELPAELIRNIARWCCKEYGK